LSLGSGSTAASTYGNPLDSTYLNTSTAAPTAAPAASPAHLTVRIPADAEVRIDGEPTTSTGSVREYRSPPLQPGSVCTYEVQARWQENGRTVTQTHRVDVSAGSHATTIFPSTFAGK
jgi:uncharacterized protein (TIGR03000 family)